MKLISPHNLESFIVQIKKPKNKGITYVVTLACINTN